MKLLSLSTYSIKTPRHGGQIRVDAIHRTLKGRGFETKHVSVVPLNSIDESDRDELTFEFDADFHRHLDATGGRTDVDSADFFISNKNCMTALRKTLEQFRPNVISLEHPWLWPAIKFLISEGLDFETTIIYSAHNIEADLISDATKEMSTDAARRVALKVEEMERELCLHADGIIAVSESDRDYFLQKNKNVILLKNGVWPRSKPGGLEYWSARFKKLSCLLFVGSAHPPNAEGFSAMLGPKLTYLSPAQRIIVVGSVANILEDAPGYRNWYGVNAARVVPVGLQDEGGLSSMIQIAQGFVLPIVSGGGTNLKTAEALYSRKPVIGTSRALRGFDDFRDFPTLTVADDPSHFKDEVKRILADDYVTPSLEIEHVQRLEELTWTNALQLLEPWVSITFERKRQIRASNSSASRRLPVLYSGLSLKDLLVGGWHDCETDGVWTSENIAILNIPVPWLDELESKRIVFEASVSSHNSTHCPKRVEFYCNSGFKAEMEFDKTGEQIDTLFEIDGQDADDGFIEVYIQSSYLASPAETDSSDDNRMLGVKLINIRVAEHQISSTRSQNIPTIQATRDTGVIKKILSTVLSVRTGG